MIAPSSSGRCSGWPKSSKVNKGGTRGNCGPRRGIRRSGGTQRREAHRLTGTARSGVTMVGSAETVNAKYLLLHRVVASCVEASGFRERQTAEIAPSLSSAPDAITGSIARSSRSRHGLRPTAMRAQCRPLRPALPLPVSGRCRDTFWRSRSRHFQTFVAHLQSGHSPTGRSRPRSRVRRRMASCGR
jgi:hypothetical protein